MQSGCSEQNHTLQVALQLGWAGVVLIYRIIMNRSPHRKYLYPNVSYKLTSRNHIEFSGLTFNLQGPYVRTGSNRFSYSRSNFCIPLHRHLVNHLPSKRDQNSLYVSHTESKRRLELMQSQIDGYLYHMLTKCSGTINLTKNLSFLFSLFKKLKSNPFFQFAVFQSVFPHTTALSIV